MYQVLAVLKLTYGKYCLLFNLKANIEFILFARSILIHYSIIIIYYVYIVFNNYDTMFPC